MYRWSVQAMRNFRWSKMQPLARAQGCKEDISQKITISKTVTKPSLVSQSKTIHLRKFKSKVPDTRDESADCQKKGGRPM